MADADAAGQRTQLDNFASLALSKLNFPPFDQNNDELILFKIMTWYEVMPYKGNENLVSTKK